MSGVCTQAGRDPRGDAEDACARMAREFRVGAVQAESLGGQAVSWQITLSAPAMREIARRLDSGVAPSVAQAAQLGRLRAAAHRAQLIMLEVEQRREREWRPIVALVRGVVWALVVSAGVHAALDLGLRAGALLGGAP